MFHVKRLAAALPLLAMGRLKRGNNGDRLDTGRGGDAGTRGDMGHGAGGMADARWLSPPASAGYRTGGGESARGASTSRGAKCWNTEATYPPRVRLGGASGNGALDIRESLAVGTVAMGVAFTWEQMAGYEAMVNHPGQPLLGISLHVGSCRQARGRGRQRSCRRFWVAVEAGNKRYADPLWSRCRPRVTQRAEAIWLSFSRTGRPGISDSGE